MVSSVLRIINASVPCQTSTLSLILLSHRNVPQAGGFLQAKELINATKVSELCDIRRRFNRAQYIEHPSGGCRRQGSLSASEELGIQFILGQSLRISACAVRTL